ncbi:MAG: EF-hand domain-containing protein [Sphingomonadaceae bacterium]
MKRYMFAGTLAMIAMPVLAQITPAKPVKPAMGAKGRAEVEARVKDRLIRMDTNRDGAVSRDEMRAYAETASKERRAAMFTAMDADNNGSVSRAEFDTHGDQRMAMRGQGKRERRMAMYAMKRFADADGRIVIADAVSKALARFDAADANKDGTLTPEERRAAREAMRAKWQASRS